MPDSQARLGPAGQPGEGLDDLDALLRAHRPGATPARSVFETALGQRFARDVEAQRVADGGRRWRMLPGWLAPRWATAAGALALAAVFAIAVWVAGSPRVPPALAREDLIQRNAEAWAGTTTLVGSFTTGDGWYFEEWLRRGSNGVMYKRYSSPPTTTVLRPQWNVSDGRTEWVVDADSRAIRAERRAGEAVSADAPPQERMQCAALALPASVGDGPDPHPAVLNGEPVYRLVGRTAEGQPAVYWVDARDYLVRRIDRPGGATVWSRGRLDLSAELTAEVFRPDALANM